MDKSSLIYPLFVQEGEGIREEIPSMPGQYRYSLDILPEKLSQLADAGVGSVMLFGIPAVKDEVGSGAYAEDGIVQKALRKAKAEGAGSLLYYGCVYVRIYFPRALRRALRTGRGQRQNLCSAGQNGSFPCTGGGRYGGSVGYDGRTGGRDPGAAG